MKRIFEVEDFNFFDKVKICDLVIIWSLSVGLR